LLSGPAWVILMAMAGSAPEASDPPDGIPVEDETEMTSIMSADQRKALQEAAGGEPEAHERDTARPLAPVVDPEMVAIPKAAAVPSIDPAHEALAASSERAVEPSERPAASPPVTQDRPGSAWNLLAFLLLAASIVYALRG
jgi:hypothetical protein